MDRKQMIESLYKKCPEQWPDVRRYNRPDVIFGRMLVLRDLIRAYPLKKVASRQTVYRRMVNEYRLLKAQLSVLSVDAEEDRVFFKVRQLIDGTLGKANSKEEQYKEAHTIILMHFIPQHSDERLRQMLKPSINV